MSTQAQVAVPADKVELWSRLAAFVFDKPGARNCFSRKLAKKQRWSREFTLRAIEEYRKFIFLHQVTGKPVVPSFVVDEVWHLHLQYTESYWHHLCRDILQTDLHHTPGDGDNGEAVKYATMRAEMFAAYRRYFGEPPWDIWNIPPADASELARRMIQVLRGWLFALPQSIFRYSGR